jgi:chromosome segregation ATPase
MALTRDTILQAADALDAEGLRPTLAAVRKRLGSGSFTTIQEAMAEWKSRQLQAAAPLHEPPPEELTERAAALAGEIWKMARAAADLALVGQRQQIESEQAELRRQVAEAVEMADALTEESEELKRELAELRPLRVALEKTAAELAEVRRKSAEEVHRAIETANRKDRETIEAQKAEKAAIERAAKAEGKVEALKEQLAEMRVKLKAESPTKR